jgi:hypothetical protein
MTLDTNDLDQCLATPVFFQFPCNCSPEDCKPALERYENDPQHLDHFIESGMTVKDLTGKHTWRSAHHGRVFVTKGIYPAVWGGWFIGSGIWGDYNGVGGFYNDKFYVHHFVLCDDLTPDQIYTWEIYRINEEARRLAYLNRGNKPTQLNFL